MGLLNVKLTDIKVLENTRRIIDKDKISELALSIKKDGVKQPVILRKAGKKYELVAGQRRYLASKEAGLKTIPSLVENISDDDVLRIQIIENLQRENLTPLEEIKAFGKYYNKDMNIKEIAEYTGKPMNYVHTRIKASKLPKFFLDAFDKNLIKYEALLELAKYDDKIVKLAVSEFESEVKDGYQIDLEDIKDFTSHAMIMISHAPFKASDALLDKKAGACNVCPKNSAVQEHLFPDLKKAHCLDKECFSHKVRLHLANVIQKISASGKEYVLISEVYNTNDEHTNATPPELVKELLTPDKFRPHRKGKLVGIVGYGSYASIGKVYNINITLEKAEREKIGTKAPEKKTTKLTDAEKKELAKEALIRLERRLELNIGRQWGEIFRDMTKDALLNPVCLPLNYLEGSAETLKFVRELCLEVVEKWGYSEFNVVSSYGHKHEAIKFKELANAQLMNCTFVGTLAVNAGYCNDLENLGYSKISNILNYVKDFIYGDQKKVFSVYLDELITKHNITYAPDRTKMIMNYEKKYKKTFDFEKYKIKLSKDKNAEHVMYL